MAAVDVSEVTLRVVTSVVVKRIEARLWSRYGHWWVEVDGTSSYGWWPRPTPMTLRRVLLGGPGELNAVSSPSVKGTATRDPYHGEDADFSFCPLGSQEVDDELLHRRIRDAAAAYRGSWGWRWPWSPGPEEHCRTFQLHLLGAAGLVVDPSDRWTAGAGCPFMLIVRKPWWRLRRRWRSRNNAAGAARSDLPKALTWDFWRVLPASHVIREARAESRHWRPAAR